MATKVLAKYKNLPSPKKYAAAIKLIEEEGWSQRSAAAATGISRSRLNERLRERREAIEEGLQRTAAAAAERQTVKASTNVDLSTMDANVDIPPDQVRDGALIVEKRRVPSPTEFLQTYFTGFPCWDCGIPHSYEKFHEEIIETVCDPKKKRVLINVPPGHAKTTVGSVIGSVYEFVRDPNYQIALISKTDHMAELMLRQAANMMMDTELYANAPRNLIEDFGPFHDGRPLGGGGEFIVAGRQSIEKDPSMRAFGIGSHIYGIRAHKIVCDDIADAQNQVNMQMIEKQMEAITQEYQSRIGQSGKIDIIGTRVAPGDIYSRLQELPAYEVIRYPCILDDEEEVTLWPEHFPYAAAALQRDSMSMERWQLVYQNSGMPSFGASFQLEHIEKCYDSERVTGHVPEGVRLVAGLDPAGSGERSGYTAFVLMGVDMTNGKRYLVDLVNHKQMRAPQIYEQMVDWAERYRPYEFRVEYNTLQHQLFQYNDDLKGKLGSFGVRLTPHYTNRYNKADPEFGVEAMAPLYHNGMVSIPHGDIATRQKFKQLTDQLLQFGIGQVTDLVMAHWFADIGCREIYKRGGMPMFDSRKSVPRWRTRNRQVRDRNGRVRYPTLEEANGLTPEEAERFRDARRMSRPVNM